MRQESVAHGCALSCARAPGADEPPQLLPPLEPDAPVELAQGAVVGAAGDPGMQNRHWSDDEHRGEHVQHVEHSSHGHQRRDPRGVPLVTGIPLAQRDEQVHACVQQLVGCRKQKNG